MKILTHPLFYLSLTISLQVIAQPDDPKVDPFTVETTKFGWSDLRDAESVRPSPNAVVGLQTGFSRVMISYGSPAVKGREFGTSLARWDNIWRTGANESTVFSTTEDILIEGKELPRGTYSLLTIPGKEKWTIIFNKNPKIWSINGYEKQNNIIEITVPSHKTDQLQERLIFYFDEIDTKEFSARAVLKWEYWKVGFEIKEL